MKKLMTLLMLLPGLFGCLKSSNSVDGTSDTGKRDASTQTDLSYQITPPNAKYIFIAAHDGNLDNYKQPALIVLKNYVESRSNGEIGIRIIPNGQLVGNINEGVTGIMAGSVDIINTTGDLSAFWEPISVIDLPYMLENDRMAEAVFNETLFLSDIRTAILENSATSNLRIMIVAASGGWRNFATTKKQIKTPIDVKGLKIRTIGSRVQQQLVTVMEGSPTPMPFTEVYSSLSTGVVDGTKNGLVDIVSTKLHEPIKFIILDGHAYMAGYWFINNTKFTSMSKDLQKTMIEGFDAMKVYLNAYPKFSEISAMSDIAKAKGTIYTPSTKELEMFKEKGQLVVDWYLDQYPHLRTWYEKYTFAISESKIQLARLNAQIEK